MSDFVDFDSLWRVAALSAAFGVGMVGLYALGLAGIAGGADDERPPGPLRRALSALCFAACLALVVFGIAVMLDK
ncbi:hypothetical protein [Miltoncostaea marina]|uniref:hypothetical protein n=1 Tax=Miltoncostaea marina TaxID=2843215 RepID=UPI001C3C2637|nr:hypothetical protein [Miltoncostaea marina]